MHEKYDKQDYVYHNTNNDKTTIFKVQSITKNIIFYKCNKRRNCPGTAQFKLYENEFIIIKNCDYNINHDNIKFEKFYDDFNKNNLKSYNFKDNKKLKKYFIKSININKQFKDIPSANIIFHNFTGLDLILTYVKS